MDPDDLRLRNRTYGLFVELGRAPTAAEIGDAEGIDVEAVLAGWRRLHEAHAIVLDADGETLRMTNPFSGVPTAFRVRARGHWWYANCAWDAFGICAALGADGRIETVCRDCGDPIEIEVRDGRADDDSLLFHCLVPAAHWWDDIGHT